MNEKDPELPGEIRKVLKESPTLTPPESYYKGVLRAIERKSEGAKEEGVSLAPSLPRSFAHWFWGVPAKAIAAACVLVVVVWVTRETRQPQPPRRLEAVDRLKALNEE